MASLCLNLQKFSNAVSVFQVVFKEFTCNIYLSSYAQKVGVYLWANGDNIYVLKRAIPLLGIYHKKTQKTLRWKDTCTPVFIVVLFTIAKIWKQPKCPSTGEWIKILWCVHTMEYYSVS